MLQQYTTDRWVKITLMPCRVVAPECKVCPLCAHCRMPTKKCLPEQLQGIFQPLPVDVVGVAHSELEQEVWLQARIGCRVQ